MFLVNDSAAQGVRSTLLTSLSFHMLTPWEFEFLQGDRENTHWKNSRGWIIEEFYSQWRERGIRPENLSGTCQMTTLRKLPSYYQRRQLVTKPGKVTRQPACNHVCYLGINIVLVFGQCSELLISKYWKLLRHNKETCHSQGSWAFFEHY
jgi:hypothetical protein